MKKIITLIFAAITSMATYAQSSPVLLQFTGEKNAEAKETTVTDENTGFSVTVKSTKGTISGDGAKNFQHEDEDDANMITISNSWKPGQLIDGKNASMTVTIPSDGKLCVFARSTGEDKDLCVIITQNDKRTVSLIKNTKSGRKNKKNKTVFDYAEVSVEKGVATVETYKQDADPNGDGYNCTNANIFGVGFKSSSATSISEIKNTISNKEKYYNLAGQEIQKPSKGLFIKNGKKYMIK